MSRSDHECCFLRSDGHSRQFGFVGFKSAEEAQLALEYFHDSYMDSSRLSVQVRFLASDHGR